MSFNYASRDYDTIKSDLLARASRVFPEWTDRDPSDFGMLLVDLWSYAADVNHYYADRAAQESFLATATRRASVLAVANLLDYRPRGRTPASGTITIENTSSEPYAIGQDTEFAAVVNGRPVVVHADVGAVIPAASSLAISARQGAIVEEEVLTSSASGLSGQVYSLSSSKAADGTVRIDVYEDGVTPVPYTQVDRVAQASAGSRSFSTRLGASNLIEVEFGNSTNGFVPPNGATVVATYATCDGRAGNLPANSVKGFTGSVIPGVSVTSSSAFTGGSDEESIESMKLSIPSVAAAQDRAVTKSDFIALAQTVPGVAKATISFTAGETTIDNLVTVYAQPDRADFLTTEDTSQSVPSALQDLVVDTIAPRLLLGTTVVAAPTITWEPIDITMTVFVNSRAVANTVKNAVATALDELFDFDNVKFGQLIHLGQVYRIALNVPGVDYVVVNRFTKSSTAPGSTVDTSIQVPELRIPRKGVVALTASGGISTSS